MRQGYLGFRLAPSSDEGLGASCLGFSDFSLAFPFFLPLEDLSAVVDSTAFTSALFPELDLPWEVFSFEAGDFCFSGFVDAFLEDWFTEPITPSTDGFGGALDVPGLGASGK